jgi:16S rRNA (cytosine967-C5)-methyltransferase
MTTNSARLIAINTLCRLQESREPVDRILEDLCRGIAIDQRDRQLAMAIVYGVCRKRAYLDWVLSQFSKHPLAKVKNRTLQALRTGVFQILFLDRIPDSAAVNETVAAFKEIKQPKHLTGFVNGMLRTISRKKESIASDTDPAIPEKALLNHPDWLLKRWRHYGKDTTTSICRYNNEPATLCLRVNRKLTSTDDFINRLRKADVTTQAGNFSPDAVYLPEYRGNIQTIPGYDEGLFQVQDEAAQLVTLLLGPFTGKRYLDGCAGLGGKATHLAQLLPGDCEITAVDPSRRRIELLKQNSGSRDMVIHHCSLENIPDKGPYDGILIDAPCSGTGVIGRHPDIRWNRQPDELAGYRARQIGLLQTAANLMEKGGVLVYATCSLEPEENDEVIQTFIADHPEFHLTDCRRYLPGQAAKLIDRQGFFRTIPGRDNLDGFFAARLEKN